MIKAILLTLTGFPTPTDTRSIENAVAMAQSFAATLRRLRSRWTSDCPSALYADPLRISGILAADRKKSADKARNLMNTFETTARADAIAHDHSLVRCAPLKISKRLVQEARFRDIAMVPLKEGDAAEQDIAELCIRVWATDFDLSPRFQTRSSHITKQRCGCLG